MLLSLNNFNFPFHTYVLKRLLQWIPVSISVILLVSVMIHGIPGDPVDAISGDYASENDKAELRHQLGLDRPLVNQISGYFYSISQGDLGYSLLDRRPVSTLIAERTLPTVQLAFTAIVFACVLGIPLGALAAARNHSPIDWFLLSFSIAGLTMPTFWIGPLLVLLFSLHWGWLPVSGYSKWNCLILPGFTLAIPLSSTLIRITRASFLGQFQQDYVRTARSKGLNENWILLKHILKNTALSLITVLSHQWGSLVTGTLIIEKIFDWPGLGTLIAEAIERRDYPVVQGCVLVFSLAYLLTNLVADLLCFCVDPRIQNQGQSQ